MKDILSKICENKKIELEKTKQRCSFSSLKKILQNIDNRNFKELIINSQDKKNNNIIAEIKKPIQVEE